MLTIAQLRLPCAPIPRGIGPHPTAAIAADRCGAEPRHSGAAAAACSRHCPSAFHQYCCTFLPPLFMYELAMGHFRGEESSKRQGRRVARAPRGIPCGIQRVDRHNLTLSCVGVGKQNCCSLRNQRWRGPGAAGPRRQSCKRRRQSKRIHDGDGCALPALPCSVQFFCGHCCERHRSPQPCNGPQGVPNTCRSPVADVASPNRNRHRPFHNCAYKRAC